MLARGDQAAAAAKFTEAERLSAAEETRTASAGIALSPQVDASVRQSATADQGPAPDLAAPAENPPAQAPPATPVGLEQPAAVPAAVVPAAAAPADVQPAAMPVAAQPTATSPAEDPIQIQTPANAAQAPATNRGMQLLSEAQALFKNGNYPAARDLAKQAKAGKFGVDAQADELIAQISLTEQGGALSLYETALAALRSGDNGRARALLAEVSASGDSLDENLRAKVDNLLAKLSDDKAKPGAKSRTAAVEDAEALAAQRLNAEVGSKIAEGRRLHEIDPDKAIALYEQTIQAVHAAPGLTPELTRPMVRRLEVAIEIAKKDKVEFERKMQDKQARAEIELKRLRILEADKAKKVLLNDLLKKAELAYAEGRLVECEAFAKRAMEVDPNEVAASTFVFKAKTERRYKTDLQNCADKEEGVVAALQGVDMAAVSPAELQFKDIAMPKNFKDLTRERLAMNAKLEPRRIPRSWRSRPSSKSRSISIWTSSL